MDDRTEQEDDLEKIAAVQAAKDIFADTKANYKEESPKQLTDENLLDLLETYKEIELLTTQGNLVIGGFLENEVNMESKDFLNTCEDEGYLTGSKFYLEKFLILAGQQATIDEINIVSSRTVGGNGLKHLKLTPDPVKEISNDDLESLLGDYEHSLKDLIVANSDVYKNQQDEIHIRSYKGIARGQTYTLYHLLTLVGLENRCKEIENRAIVDYNIPESKFQEMMGSRSNEQQPE